MFALIDETSTDDEAPVNIEEQEQKPSMAWKEQKSFDNKERVTRKVDEVKALIEEEENAKKGALKSRAIKKLIPINLKKLKAKIRDIFDDDEDENEAHIVVRQPHEIESMLNALYDREQKNLKIKTNTENTQKHQNASKLEAVNKTNKMMKKAGIKGLKKSTIGKKMQDATYSRIDMGKHIQKDVAKKLKIKGATKRKSKYKDLLSGVKKIQSKGGNVEGMKMLDVMEAGKKGASDKKVAEIIYTKSSKEDKRKIVSSTQAKKIIEKTGRTNKVKRPKVKQSEKQIVNEISRGNIKVKTKGQKGRA